MKKITNVLFVLIVLCWAGCYFYKMPKFSDGESVQNFNATLIDGSDFNTKDLRGTIFLLDFWGSWCGPCRKENPELVSLYNDYNNREYENDLSFEIVSVAIETNEARWKSAIAKDALHWKYHIVQLDRFKSPIATQYGVREIPTKYLINEKGVIIGVNQKVSEIRQYLDQQLKK